MRCSLEGVDDKPCCTSSGEIVHHPLSAETWPEIKFWKEVRLVGLVWGTLPLIDDRARESMVALFVLFLGMEMDK